MSTRTTRLAVISALGVAIAAATVSAQTATPAPKPMVPAASTAPSENEGAYIQKLRKLRKELYQVKMEVDEDKNQTQDENRKDFNKGINEAMNAIDAEIVANKKK